MARASFHAVPADDLHRVKLGIDGNRGNGRTADGHGRHGNFDLVNGDGVNGLKGDHRADRLRQTRRYQ